MYVLLGASLWLHDAFGISDKTLRRVKCDSMWCASFQNHQTKKQTIYCKGCPYKLFRLSRRLRSSTEMTKAHHCTLPRTVRITPVSFFFFFHWHYSPLWALACRTRPFHCFLSPTLYIIVKSIQLFPLFDFRNNKFFLLCGVVSPKPNHQPGGPGYPFLSGSSPLTCLASEALPVAYATASIALGITWLHKPHHYVKVGIPSSFISNPKTYELTSTGPSWRGRKTGARISYISHYFLRIFH
jgi:hypothetical protein